LGAQWRNDSNRRFEELQPSHSVSASKSTIGRRVVKGKE